MCTRTSTLYIKLPSTRSVGIFTRRRRQAESPDVVGVARADTPTMDYFKERKQHWKFIDIAINHLAATQYIYICVYKLNEHSMRHRSNLHKCDSAEIPQDSPGAPVRPFFSPVGCNNAVISFTATIGHVILIMADLACRVVKINISNCSLYKSHHNIPLKQWAQSRTINLHTCGVTYCVV